MPTRATQGSAGYDFSALNKGFLAPGERKLIKTGVGLDDNYAHEDEFMQLMPRSGHANKYGIMLLAGLIDSDYIEKDIGVILFNSGCDTFFWEAGDRIAQGVIQQYVVADLEVVPKDSREGGLGSTGVGVGIQ